ncbi:NADH-quinone oxidoreductase subunit F [Alicyclobacillaceae bacterium I2511]|nr:NADH-quinone oxidoreductase subunit F [Alicyclobacillaceae bacterium I2511]
MFILWLLASGFFIALMAPKRFLSLSFTLALSLLLLVFAIWGLWAGNSSFLTGPYLALTPLRAWFMLVLGVVATMSSWYRFGYHQHDETTTAFWLPIFLVSMVGVLTAQTVWIFMTAWEMMSITSFFLVVVHHNRPGVVKAGYIYLVMSQLSALAILSGLLLMAATVHSMNFSVWATTARDLPWNIKSWIFALLGLGFAIKSGIIPFHVWLPRAHPVAPAPVSSLMSGAMIKLGVFGVLQFLLFDLGPTSILWPIVLLTLGAVSSLLGVLYALMEHDLKRLLAYHSIENIGIIFLGLGVMALGVDWHQPNLMTLGLVASLFHTLNHAIFKSQLFLAAGAVEQHTGTLDAEHLGGLIRTMPGVAVGFLVGSMAISALPPFNGFLSEWLTFRGLLSLASRSTGLWALFGLGMALVLALTGALAGMCFVKASGVIFLGQPRKPLPHQAIPHSMTWPILSLAVLCLALGVAPAPMVHIIASLMPGMNAQAAVLLLPLKASLLALVLGTLAVVVAVLSRVWDAREVPRWNCGRTVDASMQFSSASFTKAVRTTLAVIYRPHRQLTRTGPQSQDFPEHLIYHGGTTPTWERYVYRPGYRLAWAISRYSTRIQAGSVRLYLTYLLATIGLILLFLH